MRVVKHLWIFWGIIYCSSLSYVQANSFDSTEWKKLIAPLNYPNPEENVEAQLYDESQSHENNGETYKQKRSKKGEQYQNNSNPEKNDSFDLSGVNVLLYIVLALLFVFLILRIFQIQFNKKKRTQNGSNTVLLEDNPDELIKNELVSKLETALKSANYNTALRFLFLQLLEQLQQKGIIEWNKYKTNGEYLKELEDAEYYIGMRSFTYDYEYFWFGEYHLSETEYALLFDKYSQLIDKIGHE